MPEVFIDGIRYEYEGEQRLLQFIQDQGKEVPFFCYHPSMTAPANCRQCMVKVGQPIKDRETGESQFRLFDRIQSGPLFRYSQIFPGHGGVCPGCGVYRSFGPVQDP